MAKWIADTAHSEVGFKVKHLMINNVKGHFSSYDALVETNGDDFKNAKIQFNIDASSIYTGNEQRDGHLKTADFFNAEKHPKVTFQGNKYEGDKLEGDLTINGVAKPVTLNVEFGGINKDPWGNTKAGFTITGKINRKDYGLNWNAALETGGFLLSDEVWINIELQLMKQA